MNHAEVFETIVNSRRSVRAFQSNEVPQDTLERIFRLAQRTPSNCNTQPWITHVVSGEKLAQLRQLLPQNTMEGKLSFDYPYNGSYQGDYKKRQHDAAQQLYGAVGLSREDKAGRQKVFMENYRFFGAPMWPSCFCPICSACERPWTAACMRKP